LGAVGHGPLAHVRLCCLEVIQEPSEHQERAGDMKEAAVGREQAVIAHRLCALAALGGADFGALIFAVLK
jgi:hypothetical protein